MNEQADLMLHLVLIVFVLAAFLIAIGYAIICVRNGYRFVLGFMSVGMLCFARFFFEAYSLADDNAVHSFLALFCFIGFPFALIGAFIALLTSLSSTR